MIRLASILFLSAVWLFQEGAPDRAQTPPAPGEGVSLPAKLGQDPGLATWTWFERSPPSDAGAIYSASIDEDRAELVVPFLEQLPEWFAAQDRHLERWFGASAGSGGPTLLLFEDREARQLAMVAVPPGGVAGSSARYLPEYDAIFSDLNTLTQNPLAWREGLLAERAAARIRARLPEPVRLRGLRWVLDGAALLLSGGRAESPAEWTMTRLGPARARALYLVLNKLDTAPTWWLDQSELLELRGPSAAQGHGAERYGAQASEEVLDYVVYQAAGQAGLLSDWIFGLEGGEDAWLTLARAALEGTEDPSRLLESLGFASNEEWLAAYYGSLPGYFLERHRRRLRTIDPTDPSGALAVADAVKTAFSDEVLEVPLGTLPDLVEPEEAEFSVIGVAEHHALAIGLAAEGELDRAAEVLRGHPEPRPDLLERELERLPALASLREAVITEAIEEGRKLRFRVGSTVHVIELVGREGERILVATSTKHSIESLAPSEFTPKRLVDNLGRKLDRTGDRASGVFAALLTGDERPLARLEDGEPDRGLREDASHILQSRPHGSVLRWLEEACRNEPRAEPLEELGARLRQAAALPELEPHRGLVQDRVRAALFVHAQALQPEDFLAASFEVDADGRFVARYEFEEPAELEDWVAAPDWVWIDEEHAGYSAPGKGFEIRKGVLRCRGEGALRWKLGLQEPFEVRWSVRTQPGPVEGRWSFHHMLHGSREPLAYAEASQNGGLFVFDPGREFRASAEIGPGQPKFVGRTYAKRLGYDGARYYLEEPSYSRAELSAPPPTGSALIWSVYSSDPVDLLELEIEGHLDPNSLDRARTRWVTDQLAQLAER